MKRFLCLAFAVMLLLSCASSAAAEEREEIEFESELAGEIDRTATEWMATGSDRALLTVLLAVEAAIDRQFGDTDVLHILSNESYIFKSGLTIFIGGFTDDYIYIITYTPSTREGTLARFPNLSAPDTASVVKGALESSTGGTIYTNDEDELLKWLQIVAEAAN